MKKILLIDTFNFIHRAYHALPKTLTSQDGHPINAVYGVTSMLLNIFDAVTPDYVVAAVASRKPTFRLEEFSGYKAHRRPIDDELSEQIPLVFDVLSSFGISQISADGYEADDVIGTISTKMSADSNSETIIASNDRDLWQLVRKNVLVVLPATKGVPEWLGPKEVTARLGFEPSLLVDFKGLRGDPSDNIPGVYGVGEKTAKTLIEKYKSVEELYKNIDFVTPESLRNKLLESYEQAIMSKRLARIITDAPIEFNLKETIYQGYDKQTLTQLLQKYNFKSLLKRIGHEGSRDFNDGLGSSSRIMQKSLF
ncbi:MAG TPA: 5'-3' exonuclease H3TH domain-containing protein [bacterium]|nr:5'-3' exonuclease H3TH domain-containing protein [bacterium]